LPKRRGVLKTVQLHARSRHAFAPERTTASSTESFESVVPQPLPDPPAAPQPSHAPLPQVSHAAKRLLDAQNTGNSVRVAEAVRDFRQNVVNPSVREFNIALQAIQATRRPGEPLNLMLDTYNDMLRHSLLPNWHTYIALLDSLTARDFEVHQAITALEVRIKHRNLTGFKQETNHQADLKRIAMLRSETNFKSAMSLFETVISLPSPRPFPSYTFTSLLRSCAIHANIDAAIHVFAQHEKRSDTLPSILVFLEMIRVYTNADQLPGAEEIFAEYRQALKNGRVHAPWGRDGTDPNRLNLLVWNQMIETYFRFNRPDKAVALVEQMLDAHIGEHQVVADPPPVSTATFTTILTGFCQLDDVETALVWFDRLLDQQATSQDPYEPTGVPMKPDTVAWGAMLDALAVKGKIQDLNRIFHVRLSDPPSRVRNTERTIVYAANMANLDSMDDQNLDRTLTWLRERVLNTPEFQIKFRMNLTDEIATAYLNRKMYDKAAAIMFAYIGNFFKHSTAPPHSLPFFLQSYALARASDTLPLADMKFGDWQLVLMAADTFDSIVPNPENPLPPDFAYQGLPSLIRDLATYKVPLDNMNKVLVRHVVLQLTRRLGAEGMLALIEETGFNRIVNYDPQQYVNALNEALEDSVSVPETIDSGYTSDVPLKLDSYLSRTLMTTIKESSQDDMEAAVDFAFTKLKEGVESGRAPSVAPLVILIEWLGRLGRLEDMHFAYSVGQNTLQTIKNPIAQKGSWFAFENAMLVGCAQSGDMEGAQQYRRRIIANGGAPSAEAYGALIYNVKDTTDDATNALELFKESQTYRVPPTQFLYNNIIAKLAKARKAEYALWLFQQMKGADIEASSVTYGTIIGACARVGDVQSAEMLFDEMTQSKKFKPRIPAYNTMMQMYTTVKLDRARALYYYEEMRKVNIAPSAHTYRLLIDAYGSIQPVDLEGLNSTWEKLKADKTVPVQDIHYASLLNAHGCVSKDLDKAIEIFNNMEIMPNALVYEALFNVFVAHHRIDLIQQYITKMQLEGVRMTAYVANSLIKGYSLLDNVEEARRLFESLEDPPEGVAAPNNSPSNMSPTVDQSTPVYREPSTWEAMVRAELGSGNRDGALVLLQRLKARQVSFRMPSCYFLADGFSPRQYPEAVYNRISGILVDH
ncbi:Pentatricopeptide repeat-containing protein, partial [Termitomyces sp. J132]